MAKAFYLCLRKKLSHDLAIAPLRSICDRLTPDNLDAQRVEHKINVDQCSALCIMNYTPAVKSTSKACALGCVYDTENWDVPLSGTTDGSFAIFRENNDFFEAITDASGSRSIWYYFDEDVLIAATSQRAIIMLLGDLKFNTSIIPWIFSTGSLGPGLAWDERVNKLELDSTLRLDKADWKITKETIPVRFAKTDKAEDQHFKDMKRTIEGSIKKLSEGIDFDHWLLPLSGGFDSRAILCFLYRQPGTQEKLKTITWGQKNDPQKKGSDGYIAKQVASEMKVNNHFFCVDGSQENIEHVLDRFIRCGEGQIDHVAAYLDGFATWKTLHDNGTKGVLRGDEGFGSRVALSEDTIKHTIVMCTCDDYANLSDMARKFGFEKQTLPQELQIQPGESLPQWRDRMYHCYRMPIALAALSDLKYSYVEQATPLLSREILTQVRQLPDDLRTEKSLFKKVVNSVSPSIPYATVGTSTDMASLLGRQEIAQQVKAALTSQQGRELLGEGLCNALLAGIQTCPSGKTFKARVAAKIKSLLPERLFGMLKNLFRSRFTQNVHGNILGFRAFMMIKMHALLQEDATQSALRQLAFDENREDRSCPDDSASHSLHQPG